MEKKNQNLAEIYTPASNLEKPTNHHPAGILAELGPVPVHQRLLQLLHKEKKGK